MAHNNKENHILLSNRQEYLQGQSKNQLERVKATDMVRGPTTLRKDTLDDVRTQVYHQQRKNRKLHAQIIETNPHFTYQLLRRSPHAHHQYILLRENEHLLQEQAFLLKELAKTEWIGKIGEAQKDCFDFLLQVWDADGEQCSKSEDKIDEINKKITFLKSNVKDCAAKVADDHCTYFSNIITHSKQYQEISRKYQQSIESFSQKQQQINAKLVQYQQKIRHLQQKNEHLSTINKGLQSKLLFYSDKTNELFAKITKLTNDNLAAQIKLDKVMNSFTKKYQSMQKCAQSNKPQFEIFLRDNQMIEKTTIDRVSSCVTGRSLQDIISFIEVQGNDAFNGSMSFECSEVLSQISFESMVDLLDEKENSLSSITNEDISSQSKYPLSSNKKMRNQNKIRQVLFSQCKNRLNFEQDTININKMQQSISKPLRFLRKK